MQVQVSSLRKPKNFALFASFVAQFLDENSTALNGEATVNLDQGKR